MYVGTDIRTDMRPYMGKAMALDRAKAARMAQEPTASDPVLVAPLTAPTHEEPVDEALVAEFGEWFLSHSPEWIAEMDELGRKGDADL